MSGEAGFLADALCRYGHHALLEVLGQRLEVGVQVSLGHAILLVRGHRCGAEVLLQRLQSGAHRRHVYHAEHGGLGQGG